MWVTPVILSGRTVRLEPLTPEHAAGLHRAADPELFRRTAQGPDEWSVAGFRREIESVLALRDSVAFAVVHLATGAAIGRTTYMEIRPEHRGLEIGRTWYARAHHGTAVNPECKHLLLRHAFETLGAIRVQLKTGHENVQSQRAIAKLGATLEGTLRNHMINSLSVGGGIRHTVMFAITSEDWPRVKAGLETRLGYAP